MSKSDDREDVIVYEPVRRRPSVNWSLVGLLLAAWAAVLIAAVVLKTRVFMVLMPVILVVLLIYLTICTVVALRSKP